MVVGLVSRSRTRRRQLHRAAHARVQDGKRRPRRYSILQSRPLRASAVAVDSGGTRISDRIPDTGGHSQGVPAGRSLTGWPRYRVSGDAEVSSDGLDRPHGRWLGSGKLVHDTHTSELGRLIPYPRFLPSLYSEGQGRDALRDGGALRNCPAFHRLVVACVRTANGAGQFQYHPPGGRGYGPDLPAEVVLVARERVVRDRCDDHLIRDLGGVCVYAARWNRSRHAPRTPADGHLHDDLLAPDGVFGPANRSRNAHQLL